MVSINLCCYNSEKYLRETLQSIINQTYKNWELIAVNDGSLDSTEAIILEFKNQGYPIQYHYQTNKGLSAARNKAIELSRGEYIAFIDHDDLWLPDKLEKQVTIFGSHLDVDFQYSNYFILKKGRKVLALKKEQPRGHVFENFLRHYPVATLTSMVRKKAMDRLDSMFDERLNLAEDYDLFMRLLYKSKAFYEDEPLAVYRTHADMGSIKFINKWPDEVEYVIEKFGNLYQGFEKNYTGALSSRRLELEYSRARIYMRLGDLKSARDKIAPYKFLSLRCFFLYFFSYMPVRFWNFMSLHLSRSTY